MNAANSATSAETAGVKLTVKSNIHAAPIGAMNTGPTTESNRCRKLAKTALQVFRFTTWSKTEWLHQRRCRWLPPKSVNAVGDAPMHLTRIPFRANSWPPVMAKNITFTEAAAEPAEATVGKLRLHRRSMVGQ